MKIVLLLKKSITCLIVNNIFFCDHLENPSFYPQLALKEHYWSRYPVVLRTSWWRHSWSSPSCSPVPWHRSCLTTLRVLKMKQTQMWNKSIPGSSGSLENFLARSAKTAAVEEKEDKHRGKTSQARDSLGRSAVTALPPLLLLQPQDVSATTI